MSQQVLFKSNYLILPSAFLFQFHYLKRKFIFVPNKPGMQIKEKIFQGFVEGREKSFEIIFRQYYKTLVSFSVRHGVMQMEAEDLVLETLHHIWEIRHDIKSPAALHVLLYTSVRNRTLTVLRDIRNHCRIIEENQEQLNDIEPEKRLYDFIRQEEIVRILDEAMEHLTPQCRKVVTALLEGKTIAEIAKEMAISVNSVKTYRLRALEMLRGILKNYPLIVILIINRL